jgi:glycerophosphoryl diester phosphodiesterase
VRHKHFSMIVMLLLAGFLSADGSADDSARPARQLVLSDRLLIIAHRGASADFPENTLPAFAAGVEAGADLVELDYRHSADGVPVVLHDETLDRTTDARRLFGGEKLPVAARTRADLERLDAGAWFAPRFAGTRLPSLEQALEVIQPGSVTLIERKAGDAQTCVELLRRLGLVERVVVQSFDWDYLRDCRRLAPELALVALGEKELTPARAAEAAELGALGVGWNAKTLTAAEIAMAHARGLRVWSWTVDDPARARELVAAGVDGLITNRPAEIRRLVESP